MNVKVKILRCVRTKRLYFDHHTPSVSPALVATRLGIVIIADGRDDDPHSDTFSLPRFGISERVYFAGTTAWTFDELLISMWSPLF